MKRKGKRIQSPRFVVTKKVADQVEAYTGDKLQTTDELEVLDGDTLPGEPGAVKFKVALPTLGQPVAWLAQAELHTECSNCHTPISFMDAGDPEAFPVCLACCSVATGKSIQELSEIALRASLRPGGS